MNEKDGGFDGNMTFRESLIQSISELKTDVRLGNQKIDALDTRINGRLKRLEKTVFGDEELKVIGLAEQSRIETREMKSMSKKWAMAIAVVVFLATRAADWMSRQWDVHDVAAAVVKQLATNK